jgi:hypothetical protein
LSSAQKRDLLGQALAAVITTALIAAPLITPSSGGPDVAESTLPAQSFAGTVPAIALAEERPAAPQQVARARVRASGRLMASAVPAMALQPRVMASTGYARLMTASAARSESRKPLSRKLTGWLTGDGTHTVRPFPTVAGS